MERDLIPGKQLRDQDLMLWQMESKNVFVPETVFKSFIQMANLPQHPDNKSVSVKKAIPNGLKQLHLD